jgi:uncharacterized protein
MVTLTYIPYHKIESLDSEQRIRKVLDFVKKDRIVLMEGRLKPEEETALIEETMESINKKFKGIEIATIVQEEYTNFFHKIIMNLFMRDRNGVTIVGPANIVKSIKKDPNKIELLMHKGRRNK